MTLPPAQPAAWYPDPTGGRFLRYWDGVAWTEHTRPLPGVPMTPPPAAQYAAPPAAQYAAPPVGVWRGPVDNRPLVRTMVDAIQVCVQKYAQFDGRASRSEFWYFQLAILLACLPPLLLSSVPVPGPLAVLTGFVLLAWFAFSLAAIVPSLAVMVRRLRDAGFAWPWIFICFVPFGGIVLLILCAQPSKYP